MMRLLYITEFPIPTPYANCVHSLKMCDAFAGLGMDVTMVAPVHHEGGHRGWEEIRADYDLLNACRLVRLPSAMPGHRIYRYAWHCWRFIRTEKPDLVFTISPFCGLASAMAGVPIIFEGHEAVGGHIRGRCLRSLLASKRLVSLVTVSLALKKHYSDKYPFPASRIHVARNAADPVAALRSPSPRARLSVGYAGSLGAGPASGRGVDLIVRAAGQLPKLDFHLFGGTAGQVFHWKKQTASANIHFHGHLTLTEVKNRLRDMDILLAPYQRSVFIAKGLDSAQFMSPMKVFDYMAQGKPIIASRLPAIEEVLTDGTDALLREPDDADGWVEAIDQLAGDPDLRTRLGRAAQLAFQRLYRWPLRARGILDHAGIRAGSNAEAR